MGYMDKLSEEHIQWLIAQNDRAANTIASRRRVLKSLPNAATATRDDLDAWWVSRSKLATGTRLVDLSHIREFYKWCILYEHLEKDPSVRIRSPKQENRIYDEKMTDETLDSLIPQLPADLARAVMLGAGAGLRVAESAFLSWENVNMADDSIAVVRSKGNFTRRVYVSPDLIRMLAAGSSSRTGNVVSGGGEPYTAAQLQRKLNRAIISLGFDFTSHDLRHRYGITSYRTNPDILAVGEQMGHRNVNTTKIYASADSAVKRKIAASVMW